MQARFAREVARSGNLSESARKAGYEFFDNAGYDLVRLPHVAAAVEFEIRSLLQTEAAPAALQVLQTLLHDANSGGRIRVDAAKILLDRAGFTPPANSKGDAAERSLAEMTAAELKEFIGSLEGELAGRATLVNAPPNAPIEGDSPSKATDFLD